MKPLARYGEKIIHKTAVNVVLNWELAVEETDINSAGKDVICSTSLICVDKRNCIKKYDHMFMLKNEPCDRRTIHLPQEKFWSTLVIACEVGNIPLSSLSIELYDVDTNKLLCLYECEKNQLTNGVIWIGEFTQSLNRYIFATIDKTYNCTLNKFTEYVCTYFLDN